MNNSKLKEYQINEGVFVIYQTIESLYQKYYGCIPKEIENKILELFSSCIDLLDINSKDIESMDIVKKELLWKVIYDTAKKK